MTDSVPAPVQALLALFTTELAAVKFPEMDAEVLSRATDEVGSAAENVARAELALDAARAALAEKQDCLLAKAQRALAYARVYVEEDPDLASRVEAITLPRMRRPKSESEREALMGPQESRQASRNVLRDGSTATEAAPVRRRGPKQKNQDTDSPASLFEGSVAQAQTS
jgi:ElaB/YqjD/DUF883 family membrane-anchored ribosome-binding protein